MRFETSEREVAKSQIFRLGSKGPSQELRARRTHPANHASRPSHPPDSGAHHDSAFLSEPRFRGSKPKSPASEPSRWAGASLPGSHRERLTVVVDTRAAWRGEGIDGGMGAEVGRRDGGDVRWRGRGGVSLSLPPQRGVGGSPTAVIARSTRDGGGRASLAGRRPRACARQEAPPDAVGARQPAAPLPLPDGPW